MKKLLKQLGLVVTGLALSITPSMAATTADLLKLMNENGITIVVDGPRCETGIDGAYQWTGIARRMVICTHGKPVDENDHNTVRHETVHALQHCKNSILERPTNTPLMEPHLVMKYANEVLTFGKIEAIKRAYSRSEWLVELEAFTASEVLSAAELMDLFHELCVMEV